MTQIERPPTAVSEYYDANTRKFLLSGGDRAIHRELWGPGVTSSREAVNHTHALVLDRLPPPDPRGARPRAGGGGPPPRPPRRRRGGGGAAGGRPPPAG